MPSVTYNGQSFAVDGRRIWILGASMQYARIPAALWPARIAAAKQAGFNTIETACPWMVHEPRRGRYAFSGDADLRGFVQACGAAGMRVILRLGPYVGAHFDGGGLPGWLIETPGVALRQANEVFLEHASRYLRKLVGEIADLQATVGGGGGPILLVQSEHAWTCANDHQAAKYLHEITRYIRESGISVPIINANDLWQETGETIDTWRGYEDLLVQLRQLHSVQPNAPRLVSTFEAANVETWGGPGAGNGQRSRSRSARAANGDQAASKSPDMVLKHLAEVLAAGAQPIVAPFHGGTNFGFLGGRLAGGPDRFVATTAAADAPLGESGERGEKYHALRRLITFANHFAGALAELDPDYQPVVLDPSEVIEGNADGKVISVVPLRGSQGRIIFVFGNQKGGQSTLVLDNGVRLPVNLGEQSVGWFAMEVDLAGSGRLEYANIMPWAVINRSIVVFHGPAKAPVYLSINHTPLETSVPAENAKPLVLEHMGMTVVICNRQQIDAAYHDDSALYVGIWGFDEAGKPVPSEDFPKPWVIRRGAAIEPLVIESGHGAASKRKSAKRDHHNLHLSAWQFASTTPHLTGTSPRFASLEGPETLSTCGAPLGYGWYRINVSPGARRICAAPRAADRVHLFVGGQRQHLLGVGPGADNGTFELRLAKDEDAVVALVDNLGRFSEGNDLGQSKGLFGHIYEVKPLRVKAKVAERKPVNPFALRGFLSGRAAGQMSESRQATWSFAHTRKSPLLIEVNDAAASGVFALNDHPFAYFAGVTGGCFDRFVLDPHVNEHFKRGNNVLAFAPDQGQVEAAEEVAGSTVLHECVEAITEKGDWGFAKWEPPSAAAFAPPAKGESKAEPRHKGQPCWWRATFTAEGSETAPPLWFDTAGLSKGQVFINGQNLGRYFTATASGKAVGPQTRLYVPGSWLKQDDSPNEIVLFDEHGFEPTRAKFTH